MRETVENSGIAEQMKGEPNYMDANNDIVPDATAPNLRTDRGDWKGF